MSADLAIGVKVGFAAGAAISGLKSLKGSIKSLNDEQQRLSARQRLIGQTLQNPLRMSRQRVNELRREYTQLGTAIDKVRKKQLKLSNIDTKLGHLKEQRGKMREQVMSVVSIGATAVVPVKLAMDFESSMADVKKVVDFDTPQQFKQMGNDILALTRKIPMAAEELAAIAASGGQLGIARNDIIGFTETIAKMSVAFDMSADQAGESMAKLANVYKIPIEQIGKLGDAINHLSNNSPAKASDIVNALGRVGGVAKQFGLTELQTASLANTFISLGKSPEVAGTAINGMLTKLMTADKQGKKFQTTLQMMGLESKDLKKAISENGEQALQDFLKTLNKLPKEQQMGALVDLFGLEYADDIAVLAGNVDLYEKSIRALKDTGKDGKLSFEGSMSKEFAARSETTAANWEIFKNSLKELGIVIGSTLLPAINSLMSSIAPIIHSISDWAAANPTLTRTLIGFIGGLALFKTTLLGGMFIVNIFRTGILQITGLFMRLGMFLMANPIGIAIGLLAVAAYLLYDNWSAVVGGAKALWQSLVTFFSGLWAKITAFFSSGIGNIAETILNFSPLGLFYQAFAGVMSWFGVTLPSTFSGFGRMLIQGLINGIKSAAAAVYNTIASIGNSIKAKFQAVMDIHSPSREFRRFGGFITQGLDIGIRRTASRPIGTIGTWAGRLKDSFTNRVGQLRADVAARVSGHRADFEQARQTASATGGVTIHFNPTINAPGGNPAQIQTALQMGLREFETLFQRMMADRERRAF